MLYLFSKILFCLLLAAGVGGFVGWLLRGSGRRSRLAEIESGWRRRLDTTEKERLALAVERDRLVRENASIKSLHSGCRPKMDALQAEIEAARGAHDQYDEEITSLKVRQKAIEAQLAAKGGGEDELPETEEDRPAESPADGEAETADAEPAAGVTDPLYDFDLPLPGELQPQKLASEEPPKGVAAPALTPDAGPAGILSQPDGEADDLKKVKGIGRVLERTLNELGVFHFRQIARWTDDDIAWVAKSLKTFPDRIRRDRWVSQAARLQEKKYGES